MSHCRLHLTGVDTSHSGQVFTRRDEVMRFASGILSAGFRRLEHSVQTQDKILFKICKKLTLITGRFSAICPKWPEQFSKSQPHVEQMIAGEKHPNFDEFSPSMSGTPYLAKAMLVISAAEMLAIS